MGVFTFEWIDRWLVRNDKRNVGGGWGGVGWHNWVNKVCNKNTKMLECDGGVYTCIEHVGHT